MNLKRRIIGLSAALYSCRSNDFDACIDRAEALWEKLTLRGHGDKDKAEANPRDARDWYASLSAAQQKQFDAFWTAYGLKKGKNRACMRWFQMGELKPEEMAHVLHAAKREREEWGGKYQKDNGQTRKWAEGWLAERRWEDHPKPSPLPASPRKGEEPGTPSLREGQTSVTPSPREGAGGGNSPVRTKAAAQAALGQAKHAIRSTTTETHP